MITRDTMFDPLLVALPGFRPQWEAFVAHWTADPYRVLEVPGELPYYILLGDLADHLAGLLAAGDEAPVAAALAVCERWIAEGDAYVANAAIAGLLEDLEGATRRAGIAPERVTPLLGARSADWWQKDTRTGPWHPSVPQPEAMVTFALPDEVTRRLDAAARAAGRTCGAYAREVPLRRLLDDTKE